MLYDVDPSTEVTGGAWYTDQELDQDYVTEIMKFVLHWIRAHLAPQPDVLSDRRKAVSAAQVQQALEESAISAMPLSEPDVRTLLLMCVYDGALEKLPGLPEQFRLSSRGFRKRFGQMSASAANAPKDRPQGVESEMGEFLTQSPCGICPVYKRCTEGAIINPQDCHYYDAWVRGEASVGLLADHPT